MCVMRIVVLLFCFVATQAHVSNQDSTLHSLALKPIIHGSSDASTSSTDLLQRQVPVVPAQTTNKSWLSRLGNALWSVVFGLFFVIPFSISFLWLNERRAAQLDVLLKEGAAEAETVETLETDLSDYDGTLVHLNSDIARGIKPIQDERFPDVKMESGCIRLKSSVEVFQWVEEEEEKTDKNSLGGGETTTKTYTYKRQWCSSVQDSSEFHEKKGHTNMVKVEGLQAGEKVQANGLVKYGEPYHMQQDLVEQLNHFQDAEKLVGSTLHFGDHTFTRSVDSWYYSGDSGTPRIGDFRASVDYVLDGPASILALQLQDENGDRTFGPYRTISRGICGNASDTELKERRTSAAKKDIDELFNETKCLDCSPFAYLCCCCNFVALIFSAFAPPQIYSVWHGKMDKVECLDSEKEDAELMKWGLRLAGWLALWLGFSMLFKPLEVLVDIIPFLGPYLGTGLAYLIYFFTFLLTLAIASLVTSVAYLLYRPLIGLMYLGLTLGVFFLIQFIGQEEGSAPLVM